ncbi:MAG: hypothetical protein CTY15_01655 [Methylocystis sp.]|nr:MAG: hypothetical protein CTY15_01655 [Methylocystis sp.]
MRLILVRLSLRLRRGQGTLAIRTQKQSADWGVSIVLAFAASAAFPFPTAQAQVFNPTVLAPSARPPAPSELETRVTRGRRGLIVPRDAEKRFVVVRRVTLQGGFPELAEENAQFARRLQDQRLTVAQVYQIAGELQGAYARRYPLAILETKSPEFANGDVTITVTDAYIEKLDLSRVPEQARALVRARLEPLVGKRRLTVEEYQRQTQLIGNIAGVSGLTLITPGAAPDGDVLVAQVFENRVTGAVNISNRLPREFGTWEFSKSFALNNALGWGEQLSVAVSSSSDFDRFFAGQSKSQAVSVDGATPIGADGLAVGAGYLIARSRPTPVPYSLVPDLQEGGERATGTFERTYARAAYPIFLAADYYLKAQASFEHVENNQRGPAGLFFGSAFYSFNRDRYNALRLVGEGRYVFPWLMGGVVTANLYYAQGLGGRSGDDAPFLGVPLSRPGASPVFNRLAAKARVDLNLPESFRLTFIGRGQTSFGQALMTPENFILDGPEAVSGYAAGTINVDRGVTVRGELTRPFSVELLGYNSIVSPYVFGAWGAGVRERPFIVERKRIWAETFGGGLRADTNFTGTPFGESLSIEFGRDYSNLLFRPNGYRTNVNFNMRFAGDPLAPDALPGSAGVLNKKAPASTLALWQGLYAGLNAGYTWDPRPEIATVGVPTATGVDAAYTGSVFLPNLPPPLPPGPGVAVGFGAPGHSAVSALGVTGRSFAAGGGYAGGAQIGYNFQSGRVVAGFEADIQGSNPRTRHGKPDARFANIVTEYYNQGGAFLGASVDTDVGLTSVSHTKNVSWLGTVRGRGGYLITPTFLAYGTGGLAYGYAEAHSFVQQKWLGLGLPNFGGGLGDVLQSSGAVGGYSGLRVGWTVGAGLEWMFGNNASVKAEYLHYDLGSVSYGLSPLMTVLPGIPLTNVIAATARTQFRGDVTRIGINYHFGATGAAAAPAAPPAAFTTGFYAGLNAGYSWDASPSISTSAAFIPRLFPELEAAPAASATGGVHAPADGVIGGGQAGYNYAVGRYVLGAEADLQGSSQSGRSGFVNAAQGSIANVPIALWTTAVTQEKTLDWFGTGRVRGGYLVTPALLAYGTAGFAYGGVTARSEVTPIAASDVGFRSVSSLGHIATARVGWTVGGGVEWKFSPAMSLKAEYLYWDLGRLNYQAGAVASSFFAAYVNAANLTASTRFTGQIARLGLNYHFDPMELVSISK